MQQHYANIVCKIKYYFILYLVGCLLVFTALIPSPGTTTTTAALPTDFIRSCRVISLSNITSTTTKTLPKQLWINKNINDKDNFYSLLMLCFSTLPPSTMAKCDTLLDTLRPLLFNLGVLHTAIVVTKSPETSINFEPAHLSLFNRCIEEVLALARHGTHTSRGDPGIILKMISTHATQVYSCCVPQYKLEEIVNACLSKEAAKPSGRVRIERLGVELSVPSQAVTVRMFQEYIKGIMDAEQSSNQQLIRSIIITFCKGANQPLTQFFPCFLFHAKNRKTWEGLGTRLGTKYCGGLNVHLQNYTRIQSNTLTRHCSIHIFSVCNVLLIDLMIQLRALSLSSYHY